MLVLDRLINVLRDPVQTIKYMIVMMVLLMLFFALVTGSIYLWMSFWSVEFLYGMLWFIESTRGKTWHEVFTTWGSKLGNVNFLNM